MPTGRASVSYVALPIDSPAAGSGFGMIDESVMYATSSAAISMMMLLK